MRAVLISIQPYWVFLIIARLMGWNVPHDKTVEVRKNYPHDRAWSGKTLIYCSKDACSFKRIPEQYQPFMRTLMGKVIGEFVCDRIGDGIHDDGCGLLVYDFNREEACLSKEQIAEYANGQMFYGWHISDLKIYDEPKELGELKTKKKCKDAPYYGICSEICGIADNGECDGREYINRLTRPPQSWCYVEAL